ANNLSPPKAWIIKPPEVPFRSNDDNTTRIRPGYVPHRSLVIDPLYSQMWIAVLPVRARHESMVQSAKPDPIAGQSGIPLFTEKVPSVFVPAEAKISAVKPQILQ